MSHTAAELVTGQLSHALFAVPDHRTTFGGGFLLLRVGWSGLGRIAGTVKIKGTPDEPVRRRVRLVRERDAVCLDEVWSHPVTGVYEFPGIDPRERYTVLAYDGPRVFRAAVQDNVQPVAWP